MSGSSLYPWLSGPWRSLDAALAAERVPQALLVHGPAGVGKRRLAEQFAQKLLCQRPGSAACGECHGCRLFLAGTHPDFIRVEPPEPGKAIGIDAVRSLCGDLALTSQYGGYRVVLIAPAHQMNLHAANALLKTLEEPAARTLIFLLTEHHNQLPATIISRCQRLVVPAPGRDEALRWLLIERPGCAAEALLAAAGGSPLRALTLADSGMLERRRQVFAEVLAIANGQEESILGFAEKWHKDPDLDDVLGWLLSWVADLLRLALQRDCRALGNPDFKEELQRLAVRLNLEHLCEYWDRLLQTRRALGGQANRQLLLEELLIRWARLVQPHHPSGHDRERRR